MSSLSLHAGFLHCHRRDYTAGKRHKWGKRCHREHWAIRPNLLNEWMYQLPGEAKVSVVSLIFFFFLFFLPSQQKWFSVHNLSCLQLQTESIILLVRLPGFTNRCWSTQAAELQRQTDARVIHELQLETERPCTEMACRALPATDPVQAGHHDLSCAPYLLNRFVRPHLTTGSRDGVSQSRGCGEDGLRWKRCCSCDKPLFFFAEKVPITEARSSEVTSSLQATGKTYILCRTLGKWTLPSLN